MQKSPLQTVTCSRSAVEKNEADEISLPSSVELEGGSSVDCFALVDCGADRNFVDYDFCKRNGILFSRLSRPLRLRLADGSSPPSGRIELGARIPLRIRDEFCEVDCLVTWLAPTHPVTLGMPWISKHCPEAVESMKNFGRRKSSGGSRDQTPPNESVSRLHVTADPATTAPQDKPLAFGGALHNATSAFEAGGENFWTATIAAIDTELWSRDQWNADYVFCLGREVKTDTPAETELPTEYSDYADVFDLDYDKNPPDPKHGITCTVKTREGKLPPAATPYPMSEKEHEEENKQIAKLLKLGRIEPSTSPTAAPAFFVKKQCLSCGQLRCTCGKMDHEKRWVIDYRALNALVDQDAYPLPSIPDLMSFTPGHEFYVKFDIDSAFHLIPVPPEFRPLLAFCSSSALYQWTVMPFGYKNAPAIFQRMINAVLSPVSAFCRAFMDDGLIWADSYEDIVSRTRQVLECLRQAGLRAKLRKCQFHVQSVNYLGHVIGKEGIFTDPAKLQGIVDFPEPRTKTDIRGFLGLVNYYREFYPNLSRDALPLTRLTKNDAPASHPDGIPDDARQAFEKIRAYWSDPAHLAPYAPGKPVELFTDASTEAWGGVIEQDGKPIAFMSGKFDDAQRNWATTDRELYACLMAHEKFRHYLQGPTTWYTDHKALESLRTTLANSPRRVHWRETLDQFPFVVRYRKGKDMHVDGFTRHSSWDKSTGENEPILGSDRFPVTPDNDASAADRRARAENYARQVWDLSACRVGRDKRGLGFASSKFL